MAKLKSPLLASVRCMLACLTLASCFGAWSQELNADLREQVVMTPKKGTLFKLDLETTIYKPAGDGPFPVVVINHGKSLGDTRFQARYQPASAARFFLQRGYAVVVPMRQGFSKSQGSYIGVRCNVESNGRVHADDVRAVLDHITAQAWADKTQILMMGQSHGGWTSLAFGPLNYPGVKGIVNFAGGLRQEDCPGWEGALARASGVYGKDTKVQSLWFYGDNDSYFSPTTFRSMFERYVAAGAKAELIAFGKFNSDSHAMCGSRDGESIWQPRVEAFMQAVGLPVQVTFPEFSRFKSMSVPASTDFALITEFEKIPYLKDSGREAYKVFLTKQLPRAFAISPSGAWGWAEMGDDPLERSLKNCNKNAKTQPRQLYAVDKDVVWATEKLDR